MGIFSRMNPEPFRDLNTAEELDAEAEEWGRRARNSAAEGHPDSAQYARDARAAAQTKARTLRS